MSRGQSRAHRGGRRSGLAPLGQRRRIATGDLDAAADARAARDLEQIRAQVTADIHAQIRATLDGRGEDSVLAEGPYADTDRESPPDLMVRLAFYAGAVGDTDLAFAYLSAARNDLYAHIRTLQDDNGSSWLRASAHAKARRAGAEWMLAQVQMFQQDEAAFAAAVRAEHVEASFGEDERLIEAFRVGAANAAASGRRRTLVACAVQIARLEGAEDVAVRVEGLDDERVGVLGRVARALRHAPSLLLLNGLAGRGGLSAAALDDIAGDGRAWRGARLAGISGREAEREHLRVTGIHLPRAFREGDGTLRRGDMRTAVGAFRAAAHRMRIAAECGEPAFVAASTDAAMTPELIDRLASLPGRVRYRALRVPIDPHEGDRLFYEVLYEGIAADGEIPMALSFRLELGRTAARSEAAKLDCLIGLLPDGAPRPEHGMWEADNAESAAAPVAGIATVALGDAPTVPVDALLGAEAESECAHQLAAWHEVGVWAALECRGCGDELMRRPRTSIDEILPRDDRRRRADAESALPWLQALACLNGDEPPASAHELLAAPRCDNWFAELDRQRRREIAARRRPASIRDAMHRR